MIQSQLNVAIDLPGAHIYNSCRTHSPKIVDGERKRRQISEKKQEKEEKGRKKEEKRRKKEEKERERRVLGKALSLCLPRERRRSHAASGGEVHGDPVCLSRETTTTAFPL